MIDARTQYTPESVPTLITRAKASLGVSNAELAERLGLSERYIQMLERGERTPRYPVQIALEQLVISPDVRH
ncbi:helix-turn-helix transcriptional regulator [Halomonas sp. NO4]|uniref:helix-turn-helix domain-containing protein n=1 Tax=Halomonas sp. NO4 TaxID=2484813 RepID=UPI0013D4075F|nr:helix-turn-helix transcriptional regulator [Halomonas sp. NO4]